MDGCRCYIFRYWQFLFVEHLSVNFFNQMEGQKEIDILRLKFQEMNQLHGTTISDLQYLTTQYEDLVSEKVLSWTQSY